MTESEDCPVEELTCLARMDGVKQEIDQKYALLKQEIKSIKTTIAITGAVITLLLTVVDIGLRFVH